MAFPGQLRWHVVMGLVFIFFGAIFHIVGMATPQWSVNNATQTNYFGLWSKCDAESCWFMPTSSKTAGMIASSVFAIIALLAEMTSLGLAILHIVLLARSKSEGKPFSLICLAAGLVACVAIVTCAIIWGVAVYSSETDNVGFSFCFCVLGAVLVPIGAFCVNLVADDDSDDDSVHYASGDCGEVGCQAVLLVCVCACQACVSN